MRRLFSLVLVLFFGLGPLAPALAGQDDTNLPACCRRHGAHHCAMSGDTPFQQAESPAPSFTAPSHCPRYPAHLAANLAPAFGLIAFHASPASSSRTHRIPSLQSSPLVLTIPQLSSRGPPTSLLS
ncbi:MAG TPA: hypothetical protein VK716_05400 [Terracidiphilus sp.]|nr:hypothetical protein [Terracidiphilus sp.]